MLIIIKRRLLGGAVVKNLPVDAEDMSFIPGSGRSPEGGNDIHSSIFSKNCHFGCFSLFFILIGSKEQNSLK